MTDENKKLSRLRRLDEKAFGKILFGNIFLLGRSVIGRFMIKMIISKAGLRFTSYRKSRHIISCFCDHSAAGCVLDVHISRS